MTTHKCIGPCQEVKTLNTDNYYRDVENLSGFVSTCKKCLAKRHKKRYKVKIKDKRPECGEFYNWNEDAIYCL